MYRQVDKETLAAEAKAAKKNKNGKNGKK